MDGLSGDVLFSLVTRKSAARRFLRVFQSAHGNLRYGGGPSFVVVVAAHPRFRSGRGDRINIHAVAGVFERQRLGESRDAGFGGGVAGAVALPVKP